MGDEIRDVLEGRRDACAVCGDSRDVLPTIPDASVDAVICDPPYPEIDRDYGRMTEAEWFVMMDVIVPECRRVLKPTGSAVFILQPNSERVGRMRTWLWHFMAKWGDEWNMVQDAWWWNTAALPTVHCHRDRGLMRPSLKVAVWLGAEDCWRNQSAVLWEMHEQTKIADIEDRALRYRPSGFSMRNGRLSAAAQDRGGSTPFNVLPMGHDAAKVSGRVGEHGASTPLALCDWWVRYITPPGGLVLDPFCGSGTTGIAAVRRGCRYIGVEKMPKYHAVAVARIAEAQNAVATPLFTADVAPAPVSRQLTFDDVTSEEAHQG
jgi:DNA modification methylase